MGHAGRQPLFRLLYGLERTGNGKVLDHDVIGGYGQAAKMKGPGMNTEKGKTVFYGVAYDQDHQKITLHIRKDKETGCALYSWCGLGRGKQQRFEALHFTRESAEEAIKELWPMTKDAVVVQRMK